jgi:aldose 1-epimerase
VPASKEIELTYGAYRAVVTRAGAALLSLTYDGDPLVSSIGEPGDMPWAAGAILTPRLGRVEGGPGVSKPWKWVRRERTRASFTCAVDGQVGYSFALRLRVDYGLAADGLTVSLTATNVGVTQTPYGCSIRPWLVGGHDGVDDWTLHLPAASCMRVYADCLLLTGTAPVSGGRFDFRAPRRIGRTRIDHVFSDVFFASDGTARATVTGIDGIGTGISWDQDCRWIRVRAVDLPGRPADRRGVAIGPMTCAPDALGSGEGIIGLRPGATHTTRWLISAVFT